MIKWIFDNSLGNFIILCFLIIGLRTGMFYCHSHAISPITQVGFLSKYTNYINLFPFLAFVITTIFVLFKGIMINRMVLNYNIIEKPGYSVFLFYILLNSAFSSNLTLNNVNVAEFFFLFGIIMIYKFLKTNYTKNALFISAMLFGLSAMCIPEFYWSITLLITCVVIFKPVKVSDIIVIISGLFMPYYLIASLSFLISSKLQFFNVWEFWIVLFKEVKFEWGKNGMDLIFIGINLVYGLFGLARFFGTFYRTNVETRRSKMAMAMISVFVTFIFVYKSTQYEEYFSLFTIPLSMVLPAIFEDKRNEFWKETFLILWFVLLLTSMFKIFN